MTTQTPRLGERLVPLLIFVYVVAAIRLGLDFWSRENAFWFGTYFTIPIALAYIGLGRRWGEIRWTTMAGTMLLVGLCGLVVANTISYTTAQFMEWTDGRFSPVTPTVDELGNPVLDEAGDPVLEGVKGPPPQETTTDKLLHGLGAGAGTGGAGTVWCLIWGTLLIWLPVRCCPKK